jgi:ribosomal protein L29
MTKLKQLRSLDGKDLDNRVLELMLELAKERSSNEIGTSKNPGRTRTLRKELARLLTIRTENTLGIRRGAQAVKLGGATEVKT